MSTAANFEGLPGAGFFAHAKLRGVPGSENLPDHEYVEIPFPTDIQSWCPLVKDARVEYRGRRWPEVPQRCGSVVKYARSKRADDIFSAIKGQALLDQRALVSDDYECLIENEGPVVCWDDDGSESWFPGQSMAILEVQ